MGSRLVIHCEPRIAWQQKRCAYFVEGLKRKGIAVEVTNSRHRLDDSPAVLLGTTCWRSVEVTGQFLLVDRCSFGDTNEYVSLVWNGHGRRGDHRVPVSPCASRWERIGVDLVPWRKGYSRVVLCGQTETYTPRYGSLAEWYRSIPATHFRSHPAGSNPTGLPEIKTFEDAAAVTLNSSIAVQCVLNGIPTVTMDEGSMAWDVTGHHLNDVRYPDRAPWCHALAWTQWSDQEIREGIPWDFLFTPGLR